MPALTESGIRAIEGDLTSVPLPELLQFFHVAGKDGALYVAGDSGPIRAWLHYRARRIVHASCDELQGPEAVYSAMAFSSGRFGFLRDHEPAPAVTIQETVQNLILEGLRRLESRTHVSGLLPPDARVLYLAPEPPQDDIRLTAREWGVLQLVNGKRTLREILDASGHDETDARAILIGLVTADLVVTERNDAYLDAIVLKPVARPGGSGLRYAAPTLVGTLLLKKIDGVRSLRALLDELRMEESALAEEIRLLLRTQWVEFVSGQREFQRWLAA